ncbi:MAG: hypothetical protein M3378_11585 [Actinomycetota bacterium]|nr:hypothetical protein [Actinomycetota bacterium]
MKVKRAFAVLVVVAVLGGSGCSGGVSVDDKGDGVRIEGDVDQQPPPP